MKAPRENDTDLHRGIEPLRTTFAILILLLGFVAGARADSGFGVLEARTGDAGPVELVALSSTVDVAVSGLVAEARIRQRFTNTSDAWVEAQYLLPLPDGAAVHDLELRIGSRVVVGEIREKEQARAEYVEAAASGRRAALVEADRPQLFRTAVANIAPGETVEVDVRWWQSIAYRDGRFRFALPLTYTPRYTQATEGVEGATGRPSGDDAHAGQAPRVGVRIAIDAGLELSRVESASHRIAIAREGRRHTVTLADGEVPADRDFTLEWTPVLGAEPGAAVLAEQHGGETYAMVMLLPREELANPLPRELVLVVDTSGSMEGESLRQARAALDLALTSLTSRDRFNVIQFNSVTEALFDAPVAAQPGDVKLAREWVARLQATGGTEMAPALERALAGSPPSGYVRQVVFATDGAIDDAGRLYTLIDRDLRASRLFPVGIGSAPNTAFIERAATLGRGTSITIADLDEVSERMRTLFTKLERPALRDLALAWPGAAEVYPSRLPDLYAGEPLLVVARLPAANGTLHASAHADLAPWQVSQRLDGAAHVSGIARLWARRKIDDLERSLDMGGDADAVREGILALALDHHLVTRYTSLVAVEKAPARPLDADLASTRVANGAPTGGVAFAATATGAPAQRLLGFGLLALALLTMLAARRVRHA